VPTRDAGEEIAVAAGERIVAVARPGKPPEIRLFPPIGPVPAADPPLILLRSQWFLKFVGVGVKASGTARMATTTKKRATRKSLSQPGWITLDGGFAARRCVVQNMSATGAKITINDPNPLPAKLRLAFSRGARTGGPCEVVWRRAKSVGVKFVR